MLQKADPVSLSMKAYLSKWRPSFWGKTPAQPFAGQLTASHRPVIQSALKNHPPLPARLTSHRLAVSLARPGPNGAQSPADRPPPSPPGSTVQSGDQSGPVTGTVHAPLARQRPICTDCKTVRLLLVSHTNSSPRPLASTQTIHPLPNPPAGVGSEDFSLLFSELFCGCGGFAPRPRPPALRSPKSPLQPGSSGTGR